MGRARRALTATLEAAVAALAVVSFGGHLGPSCQITEIASHFRFQTAVCGVLGALGCALLGRWRWALLAAAVAVIDASLVIPWYLPPPETTVPATGPTLDVLLANVNKANRDHEPLLRLIAREKPPLVVLLETDYRWVRALRPLRAHYPHREIVRRHDAFGISVLSVLPFRRARTLVLPGSRVPSVLVALPVGDRELSVLAVHCMPPISPAWTTRRDLQLHAAARLLRDLPSPRLFVGDLNLSMWSPAYDDLEQVSTMRNARRGFGVLPTWPVKAGLLGAIVRVPLDHALVDSGVVVRSLRRGTDIGSDHLPLLLEIQLK